jgi:hypothetical protein
MCAALMRAIRRVAALASAWVLLASTAAAAQTPASSPTPLRVPKAPPPWTYYMAIGTIAIAGLTLVAVVLGYLVQAPGFRRGEGGPAPGRPGGAAS